MIRPIDVDGIAKASRHDMADVTASIAIHVKLVGTDAYRTGGDITREILRRGRIFEAAMTGGAGFRAALAGVAGFAGNLCTAAGVIIAVAFFTALHGPMVLGNVGPVKFRVGKEHPLGVMGIKRVAAPAGRRGAASLKLIAMASCAGDLAACEHLFAVETGRGGDIPFLRMAFGW